MQHLWACDREQSHVGEFAVEMSIFNLGVLKLNMSIGLFMVDRVSRANRDFAMKKGVCLNFVREVTSSILGVELFHPTAPLGVDFHFWTCRGLHGAYENKQEGLLRR